MATSFLLHMREGVDQPIKFLTLDSDTKMVASAYRIFAVNDKFEFKK